MRKRLFDVVLACFLLLLLSPFFILITLLLFSINGRPIFFLQKRMGRGEKPFTMYKFRTMKLTAEKERLKVQHLNEAPFPSFKILNDPRFVRFGKVLSRTGLDELPQLFNILRGEMSFIGPRPLPITEAQATPKTWSYRYSVRPGILSLWALSSRRFESLQIWEKLEKQTLKQGKLIFDLSLLFRSALIPVRYLQSFFRSQSNS